MLLQTVTMLNRVTRVTTVLDGSGAQPVDGIIKKMMALMMNMATIVISPDSRSLLGKHRQTDTAIQTYTD